MTDRQTAARATAGIVASVILLIVAASILLAWAGAPLAVFAPMILFFGMAVGHMASAIIWAVWS